MSKHEGNAAFPEDFFWGASTASHQVEGGTYNQWTVWELENAQHLAKTAEKRLGHQEFWEKIKHQATDPNNYVSGEGVDHFNMYKHDFDLAKSLNLNAFRFSIEWSRIEPEEGKWNEEAIKHYRTYIKELKKRGIEPFLNIWHWTNPVWFEEKGGFMKRKNIKYFLRFAATIMEEFGDLVNYTVILNEPNVYAWTSFLEGRWPAPKKSVLAFGRAYANLMSTHRQAYRLLKDRAPHIQYSSAPQLVINVPVNKDSRWQQFCAWTANWSNNWLWLRVTKNQNDFIGFNNYFKNYVKGIGPSGIVNPSKPLNDLGWYMEPKAVGEMALAISKKYPDKPIFITENGVADSSDKLRQWWLEETLKTLLQLRTQGVNLVGYFHWSLLDNFEWAEGWWPKFGLIEVDRENNMKRKVRPSAKWLAQQIKYAKVRQN